MNLAQLSSPLSTLLSELVDGAPVTGAYVLNPGDQGLLRSLDRLSAEAVSKIWHGGASIAAHTDHVLKEVQKELEKAGSSMEHVLKCNVYLADLADYKKMNEVYRGRFGKKPPVRTTIAAYGGIPGNSLVEIDVIATLK